MRTFRALVVPTLSVALALLPGCGGGDDDGADGAGSTSTTSATTFSIDPGDGGRYEPDLDPASMAPAVDNPWFPLPTGAYWRYEGTSEGEREVVEIEVLDETREVMGIATTVVRDTVTVDGELVEDTRDWFAQDVDGNVWYLGEESKDYERGEVVSTEGSWEAGVDGALPGIVMPAQPRVGDAYRQEYLPGEAEDMMRVVAVGGSLDGPAGSFTDVVTTEDWTPLEPDVVERKSYAAGVGKLREEETAGGDAVVELVEYRLP